MSNSKNNSTKDSENEDDSEDTLINAEAVQDALDVIGISIDQDPSLETIQNIQIVSVFHYYLEAFKSVGYKFDTDEETNTVMIERPTSEQVH